MVRHWARPKSNVSRAEYQRFAEQFTDCILDPRQPWLVQYVLTGGLANIPTDEELSSSAFAQKVLRALEQDTWLWEAELYEAFTKRDRSPVVTWILERTIESELTKDEMRRLLACVNSTILRTSLKRLNQTFTFSPGAKRKLPAAQYARLLETAESLEPAILQLLNMPKTSRTLREVLLYLKKDHPKVCEFLTSHIARLQEALDDTPLFLRAKRDLGSRARVLAEALAGSEFQLTFSTSRECVRRARLSSEKPTL